MLADAVQPFRQQGTSKPGLLVQPMAGAVQHAVVRNCHRSKIRAKAAWSASSTPGATVSWNRRSVAAVCTTR